MLDARLVEASALLLLRLDAMNLTRVIRVADGGDGRSTYQLGVKDRSGVLVDATQAGRRLEEGGLVFEFGSAERHGSYKAKYFFEELRIVADFLQTQAAYASPPRDYLRASLVPSIP